MEVSKYSTIALAQQVCHFEKFTKILEYGTRENWKRFTFHIPLLVLMNDFGRRKSNTNKINRFRNQKSCEYLLHSFIYPIIQIFFYMLKL